MPSVAPTYTQRNDLQRLIRRNCFLLALQECTGGSSQDWPIWWSLRSWHAVDLRTLDSANTEPTASHHLRLDKVNGCLLKDLEIKAEYKFIEKLYHFVSWLTSCLPDYLVFFFHFYTTRQPLSKIFLLRSLPSKNYVDICLKARKHMTNWNSPVVQWGLHARGSAGSIISSRIHFHISSSYSPSWFTVISKVIIYLQAHKVRIS